VWGQRVPAARRAGRPRFTPTCVGTTRAAGRPAAAAPVHPHVCGDNAGRCAQPPCALGSPPRVWGQPLARSRKFWLTRFTPTCVGTTAHSAWPGAAASVHPHVCGDNSCCSRTVHSTIGSPPRVWGQLSRKCVGLHFDRFTPTCVGTTANSGRPHAASTVHPHVCGDNAPAGTATTASQGSPPRVWGQLDKHKPTPPERRFTPTCVGTTCSVSECCV